MSIYKNPYQKFLIAKNCIKKGSRNLYTVLLKKFSLFLGQFFSSVLVESNIWHKKVSITNAVLQNDPQKYMFRSYFMNFVRPKISDKLSVIIDHV